MIYQPQNILTPGPLHICTVGRFNSASNMITWDELTPATGAAWPGNNLALYVPMAIPFRFTVARFLIANSSNATGNVDVGLYNSAGLRLLSTGSTSRGALTSQVQYIGVTDQSFPPGHYYLALVGSSTTGTYLRTNLNTARQAQACGLLQEALGSTVLPATMAPAAYTPSVIFNFGLTQSDTL